MIKITMSIAPSNVKMYSQPWGWIDMIFNHPVEVEREAIRFVKDNKIVFESGSLIIAADLDMIIFIILNQYNEIEDQSVDEYLKYIARLPNELF